MARKIIGIKVYYLKKIFLHNKIHLKIHSIIAERLSARLMIAH